LTSAATRLRSTKVENIGAPTASRIAEIATTISNSISVTPCCGDLAGRKAIRFAPPKCAGFCRLLSLPAECSDAVHRNRSVQGPSG